MFRDHKSNTGFAFLYLIMQEMAALYNIFHQFNFLIGFFRWSQKPTSSFSDINFLKPL